MIRWLAGSVRVLTRKVEELEGQLKKKQKFSISIFDAMAAEEKKEAECKEEARNKEEECKKKAEKEEAEYKKEETSAGETEKAE